MKHACLFLLFCCQVSAQNDQAFANWLEYTQGEAVIIAPAGLNLREKPTLQSRVLRSIAFGEKVKIIGSTHYGVDTVGNIDFYYSDILSSIPIDGYWLKIEYHNTQGYMFSAYLDKSVNTLDSIDKGMNLDYILLSPINNCMENYFYRPGWYWYGFYETEAGIIKEKVEISFYNLITQGAIGKYRNIIASSSNNKLLRFIIGTKNPLPTLEIKPVFFKGSNGLPLNESHYLGTDFKPVLQQCNLQIYPNKSEQYDSIGKLILTIRGTRQILGSADMGLDIAICTLLWCGDLDGDKKNDYIIMYGDTSAKTILYLSKPAEKGKLVKPVAVYYSGYCC